MNEKMPPLRMAPGETPEELARRFERETRRVLDQREAGLENSIAPFRVGSVPTLNTVPLTRGIEDQVVFAPPSRLAQMLRRNELDAALVSVTECLLREDYDVLDGIAIASLGEVKSVLLAHRQPLEEIREIFADPASLASLHLLKVLLAERGLKPEFKPLPDYTDAPRVDNVMLIGNEALDFLHASHPHRLWDLGAAWFEMTGLPFVYAVWTLRRGVENTRLRRLLREARDFGLDTLDSIIAGRTEYTEDFRRDYLGWHIHFHLGASEKQGMARFIELLNRHGLGPAKPPRFVG